MVAWREPRPAHVPVVDTQAIDAQAAPPEAQRHADAYDQRGCPVLVLSAEDDQLTPPGWTLMADDARANKTALHQAVSRGDVAELRAALARSSDRDQWLDGHSLFLRAATDGRVEVMDLLIELWPEADLEETSLGGDTALHLAASAGHLEFVTALLDRGAHLAARSGVLPSERPGGLTALMCAADHGHVEVLAELLERGADIHARDSRGMQPIHFAASRGHLDAVRVLCDRGADSSTADHDDRTSAVLAAMSQRGTELLAWFFARGTDCHAALDHGSSFLHKACHHGAPDMVRLLLDCGLSPNRADDHGTTALIVLCHAQAPNYRDADRLACHDLLLQAGADIALCNNHGTTPLHAACASHHAELVDKLLDRGAALEAEDRDGRTPLFVAVHNGHQSLAKALLARGADPAVSDRSANTLLHLAAGSWDPAWAALVADLGIDLNALNADGKTALDYSHSGANPACDFDELDAMNEIESLLRQRGALSSAELQARP